MLSAIKQKLSELANRYNILNNFVSAFTITLLCAVSFSAGVMFSELGRLGNPYLADNSNNQPEATGDISKLPKPGGKDLIRGNKNAEIALIEYSDIDCPFCKAFHTTAVQALEQNNNLMWVHRDFPLESLHPEANAKAIAINCVQQVAGQDKAWQVLDKLYEDDEKLSEVPAIVYAAGVDKAKFDDCNNNKKTQNDVTEDYNSGLESGVNGTPGNFIINLKTGKVVALKGAEPLQNVLKAVESVK